MHSVRQITKQRKITTFVALHDLNLAARYADRLVLMRQGRIIDDGTAAEVFHSPELGKTYGVNVEIYETKSGVNAISASL